MVNITNLVTIHLLLQNAPDRVVNRLHESFTFTTGSIKISLVCPRDKIPTDSIKGEMLNVYVEDGSLHTGKKQVVLLVTALFDNFL